MRLNIYKLLKPEFKIHDSILDVGCGGLYDLICFECPHLRHSMGLTRNLKQPLLRLSAV